MSSEQSEQPIVQQMTEENQQEVQNESNNKTVQQKMEGEQQQQQEQQEPQQNNKEDSRSLQEAEEIVDQLKQNTEQVTEKYLDNRLMEAYNYCKEKNFDQAENIFSDLMISAVKFYKSETHNKMSKFFFFYGDMLLSKLENNPDVFGEKAQKKTVEVEGADQLKNQMTSENGQQQVNKSEGNNEEDDDEDGQSQQEEEEIVQLDTVIFKDENCEIREENEETSEKKEDEITNNTRVGQISLEKSDPVDDMQLCWEHLELARKIYYQELKEIEDSSDEDKKERQVNTIKQLVEVTLRIGDLESWRDDLTGGVQEYTKALELSKQIEDREYSRTLSSVHFQLGNSILYENKEFCEEEALREFVDSAQILENCLSKKIAIPPQEIPSFKILKKEDLNVDHLKHSFLDDNESKEIKETLKILYEKIEDTIIQRDERDKYKVYQEEMKKQAQNQNQFAQPTQTNAPIKNLGTFGSLKRKEPTDSNTTANTQPATNNSNENSTTGQMANLEDSNKMIKKD